MVKVGLFRELSTVVHSWHNMALTSCALSDAVILLSLRAQLQLSPSVSKPVIIGTVTPEPATESARCNAVAWVPRSEAGTFVAAFASGFVYVYKKV